MLARLTLCWAVVFVLVQPITSIASNVLAQKAAPYAGAVVSLNDGEYKPTIMKSYSDVMDKLKQEEEVAPIVGLALAPSPLQLRQMQKKALEAQKQRQKLENIAKDAKPDMPSDCAGCDQIYTREGAKQQLPAAKAMEKVAKKRFAEAAKWAALEFKREQALPQLALAMQKKANHEHELRVAEEKRLNEMSQKTEKANLKADLGRILPLRRMVARQRLADRIRAAEDARIASLATKSALTAQVKRKLQATLAGTAQAGQTQATASTAGSALPISTV